MKTNVRWHSFYLFLAACIWGLAFVFQRNRYIFQEEGFRGCLACGSYFSPKTDGAVISCIQFAVSGILCTICAFIRGNPAWSQIASGVSTLYAGIMSCGVAYTLQIVGQRGVNPTVAALYMSLESVVATITGVLAFRIGFLKTDQTMTARQNLSCVIVFAAVVLVQLPTSWFEKKKA